MSGRSRLPRKAAETVSYTYAAPSSDEDEPESRSDEEVGGKGKRANKGKGKAAKRRRVEESESEGLSDLAELAEADEQEDKEEELEYDIPRVDFSAVLPFELVAEILSYLHPRTLYALSTLSRSLRSFFVGPNARSTWLRAMQLKELPKLGDEEVDPRKLCALLFDKGCELCGKANVELGDRFLLVRLCPDCRAANWVQAKDVGEGKKYEDLHPAVLQCAITTPLPPDNAHHGRNKTFFYHPDLLDLDSYLVELQLEDERESGKFGKEGPAQRDILKNLKQATRVKRYSWHRQSKADFEKAEKELHEQYTPRVKAFVIERKGLREQREKLAEWIYQRGYAFGDDSNPEGYQRRVFEARVREYRRKAIEDKVIAEGLFGQDDASGVGYGDKVIGKAEPFTDEIWPHIKEHVYKVIGREIAHKIFRSSGNRMKKRSTFLKKPLSRSAVEWQYILPPLTKLWNEAQVSKAKFRAATASASLRTKKDQFFMPRYEKLMRMSPTKSSGWYCPRYGLFLALPIVKALYLDDDKFGTSGPDNEKDLAIWTENFDAIVEEFTAYGLDVRFHALKLILAATTDMSADDLEQLDRDVLASPEYDDEFFLKPSSWLCCSSCGAVGDLLAILEHSHTAHPLPSLVEDADLEQRMPVELLLEVACVLSAVFELAKVDPDEPDIDLDGAFEDRKLRWENPPAGYKKRRLEWSALVAEVRRVALELEKRGEVIAVPEIALKNLTSRERWRKLYR
ncbi:hypothetical protein JCM10213_006639 [Rhodosporidiobolus nylandii]